MLEIYKNLKKRNNTTIGFQQWDGISKILDDIIHISIFTGINPYHGEEVSLPSSIEECLEKYSNISFQLHGGIFICELEKVKISEDLKKSLSLYKEEYSSICNFILVPIDLLNKCLIELFGNKKTYGGNCKKCGSFDEYAPLDNNGKCFCYKCFY